MATLAAEDPEGLPLAIGALLEIAAILEAKFPEGLPPAQVPTLGFRAERRAGYGRRGRGRSIDDGER